MASDWRELAAARDFLAALRMLDAGPVREIEGRNLEDWLAWAEEWLRRADPLADGLDGVFRTVGAVREWSYRD